MLPSGATIAPIIISLDKTQLSTFSGDKQAWPVYLTIGNIFNDVRRKPSERAVVLLGYLPVAKLTCFAPSERSLQGYRLFHFAMRKLLEPLVKAGQEGVEMCCSDGYKRDIYPILAAYVADYPEQCLVCCCKENRCPSCLVKATERGQLLNNLFRDPAATLAAMRDPHGSDGLFDDQGLREIPDPFWSNLPYTNIFGCITPDLLHQLHKGVFKDHFVKWSTHGHTSETDARMGRVPPYHGLRVFKKGISVIQKWTGIEYRQMEKVFVAVLASMHFLDPRIRKATRNLLDFIYLAHYPSHTSSTLEEMRTALVAFHENKDVFVELGIRQHFNIPKVHWLDHYIPSIVALGSCDGFSTDTFERLHIDFAKQGYRASNRREYLKQMVVWLTRREKVKSHQSYLRWITSVDPNQPRLSSTVSRLDEDDSELASYPDELMPVDSDEEDGDQPMPEERDERVHMPAMDVELEPLIRAVEVAVKIEEDEADGHQALRRSQEAILAPEEHNEASVLFH